MAEDAGPDRWARWLLGGREAGCTDDERNSQVVFLERVRDRVLDGARIAASDQVLDIGAGTGLVAVEAARRLGPDGTAVALDLSHDALAHCRHADLQRAVGDAVALPFADGTFDVAVARSVLIYVDDKRAAVVEVRRVLRRGGRVSLFEPINAAGRLLGLGGDGDVPDALREQHAQVTDTFRAMSPHWEPMMGFDERDLVRTFAGAGFETVGLQYELLFAEHPVSRDDVERGFDLRGNPTGPTWREAAVAALGADAAGYLAGLAEGRAGGTRPVLFANAFLTATAA